MKIRTEFVTNSSSSSFGAALVDIALGLGAIGSMLSLGCTPAAPPGPAEDPTKAIKNSELDAALAAADEAANQRAEQLAADAAKRDALAQNILDGQESILSAQSQKIQNEIDAYNRQWQDAQQGIDPKDPGYANLKKQYDDYQNYLKGQLDGVNSQLAEAQAAKLQEAAAQNAKSDWVRQRQEDLVQVIEDKAFVEAVAKGYGSKPGYDTGEVTRRLKDLNDREAELRDKLKAEGADINYTAQPRDPIGPSPESQKLQENYARQKAEIEAKMKAAKDAEKEAHRKELEWLNKDAQNKANQAAVWNVLTKGAEVTQVIADVGVDILATVTGPAGKLVKAAYTGLKPVGQGLGEGIRDSGLIKKTAEGFNRDGFSGAANGFYNASTSSEMNKAVGKGIVAGVSDVIKDKIGDSSKVLQAGYNVVAEGSKGALDAGLDGKDILDGAIGGASKGAIDSTVSAGLDKLLPPHDMPAGTDWTNANVSDAIKYIRGKNPLSNSTSRPLWQGAGSVTGMSRDAVKEGVVSQGKEHIKNFVKGDEVLNTGWKQGYTQQAIDNATPDIHANAVATANSMKSIGQAMSNNINNPNVIIG